MTTTTKQEKGKIGDPLEGLLADIESAQTAIKAAEEAAREGSSSEEFKELLEKDEVRRRIAALASKLGVAVQQHRDLQAAQVLGQAELDKIQSALGQARGLGIPAEKTRAAQERAAQIRAKLEKRDARIKQLWGGAVYGTLPKLGALGWAPKPASPEAEFVSAAGEKTRVAIGQLRARLARPCGAALVSMRQCLVEAEKALSGLDFKKARDLAFKGLKAPKG